MKYMIKWQKWRDPFGGDLEEGEMPVVNPEDMDDLDGEDDSNVIDSFQKDFQSLIKNKSVQVITTPMGLVPINEYSQPGKLFKFWTGHTNFNITTSVQNLIDKIEGVESLDIFSRYRMRVGVGFAFADGETLRKIDKAIEEYYAKKTKPVSKK